MQLSSKQVLQARIILRTSYAVFDVTQHQLDLDRAQDLHRLFLRPAGLRLLRYCVVSRDDGSMRRPWKIFAANGYIQTDPPFSHGLQGTSSEAMSHVALAK